MSIPKEPRQLMINLMYLVLTAMLALNVSAEIIKSFFRLDKSIKHTNEIVDLGVKETIKSMEETVKSKPHLKPLHEAAKTVPDKIKRLTSLINDLRNEITEASGGLYTNKQHRTKWEKYGYKKFTIVTDKNMDGKAVGSNNFNAPYKVFIVNNKGAEIKELIIETRKELVKIIDDLVAEIKKEPIEGVKLDPKAIEELKKELKWT